MGLLINIDTGGTLTDFCIIDGDRVLRTKTLTTPFDLSRCLIDGLKKASFELFGAEDLRRLLVATDHIRYSTTQGTNALVERKGPRLGVICLDGLTAEALRLAPDSQDLYAKLIGDRCVALDSAEEEAALEYAAVAAVNRLAVAGATRLIVAGPGKNRGKDERRIKAILLRKFPPHLLGALPVLYSHELVADQDDHRRVWTAIFNAFLHPGMERFLYSTEHRLQADKIRAPLLIFRNDGGASRVARTAAVQTYSSGPRGGAEGLRALAGHYQLAELVGMDIGGTTTDVTIIENGTIRTHQHGRIEGVATSLPLCDVVSVGVGGSSIIRIVDGALAVGPDSAGSAPGPACFGYGGTDPTITDALAVMGLLDPATYFGGGLKLDFAAARSVIDSQIMKPLGISEETALATMESAWVGKVVDAIRHVARPGKDSVLVAFGGAGPILATRIAAELKIERVLIPGLAAVFSAFGVGFSDIEHEFAQTLDEVSESAIAAARADLVERASRAMFAEGVSLRDCTVDLRLIADDQELQLVNGQAPKCSDRGGLATLKLRAVRAVPRVQLTGSFEDSNSSAATPHETRRTYVDGSWSDLPLVRLAELPGAARGAGPIVLEDAYFTALVDAGWAFQRNLAGDLLLRRKNEAKGR
ncbi:MAG: hydantoinase/oxoprolinase family protein [Gammaproteobacteria bacterium]|nr:hydantoinase/oxoprolinase family protein [Gammaproteobacteria bacterium]